MTRPMKDRETPVVELIGHEGEEFIVIGAVRRSMQEANWTRDEIMEVMNDMMNGNYAHMLRVVMDTCEVR